MLLATVVLFIQTGEQGTLNTQVKDEEQTNESVIGMMRSGEPPINLVDGDICNGRCCSLAEMAKGF